MSPSNRNVIALDQEKRGIVAVVNGAAQVAFDPDRDLARLPAGGGWVVADINTWAVRNDYSQSQYCWADGASLDAAVAALAEAGYKAWVVDNKLTNDLYRRAGLPATHAATALYGYARAQIDRLGRLDTGHPVRVGRHDVIIDRSFGQRERVVRDFLRLQNFDEYANDFMDDAVAIVAGALEPDDRPLLNLNKRGATTGAKSRNRVAAVAACTHDPATGLRRRRDDGELWGTTFITRRVLGLHGVARGTGLGGAGTPMRAVLRLRGNRNDIPNAKGNITRIDRDERRRADRAVLVAIRALQAHDLRPA